MKCGKLAKMSTETETRTHETQTNAETGQITLRSQGIVGWSLMRILWLVGVPLGILVYIVGWNFRTDSLIGLAMFCFFSWMVSGTMIDRHLFPRLVVDADGVHVVNRRGESFIAWHEIERFESVGGAWPAGRTRLCLRDGRSIEVEGVRSDDEALLSRLNGVLTGLKSTGEA